MDVATVDQQHDLAGQVDLDHPARAAAGVGTTDQVDVAQGLGSGDPVSP